MTKIRKLGPFERIVSRIPFSIFIKWVILSTLCFAIISFIAYLSGELNIFLSDFAALSLLFSFTTLICAEYWIGENVRKSLEEIQENFSITDYVVNEVQSSIFTNRARVLMGIFVSAGLIIAIELFGFWYTSFLMQITGYFIAAIVGFMVGEMFYGTICIMRNSIQIGKMIAPEINIMDSGQLSAMKSLASWGLQISVIGSIVGAVLLPAFTFAPWTSTTLPTSIIAFVGMFGIIMYMLVVFFVPTERIHQTMVDIKLGMESKITGVYMEIYEQITNKHNLRSDVQISYPQKDLSGYMDVLEKMHQRINQAPSWPFDVSQVRNLFGSVLVPVLVYMFQNYSIIMTFLGLE